MVVFYEGMGMTKFYVDAAGNYLGGFDGAEPPSGAIEIPSAPAHGLDKWAAGTWVVTPDVPQQISRRQAFAALYKRTPRILQADIEAAITAHLAGDAQFLALNDVRESQVFERAWPLVDSIGALMGLSGADMDALFIAGAAL